MEYILTNKRPIYCLKKAASIAFSIRNIYIKRFVNLNVKRSDNNVQGL